MTVPLWTTSPAAQTPIPAKPNILVIMFDQWRFDCLGANGNNLIKTPNLDKLAVKSLRCTNTAVQNRGQQMRHVLKTWDLGRGSGV